MPRNKIFVTGSNGQLGNELKDLSSHYPQYQFIFFNREEFSISDRRRAEELFSEHQPFALINCAAYTAVDLAESEEEKAIEINSNAVGHLAFLCHKHETRLIHISTDYVFNGKVDQPYRETDEVEPINVYGSSKLMGEYHAQKNDPECIIIRTSWVYSAYGKNFVKTMIRLMKEREKIGVVQDQYGAPTYAADLAECIMKIISSGQWIPGIYHYSNKGNISWYHFAQEIRQMTGTTCVVNPIATSEYPTPARRPMYSVLNMEKMSREYGIVPKDWKESLRTCLSKLNVVRS